MGNIWNSILEQYMDNIWNYLLAKGLEYKKYEKLTKLDAENLNFWIYKITESNFNEKNISWILKKIKSS